jgi:hypothetical protein
MLHRTDPLIDELKRWGNAQANRYAYTRADRSIHMLEQARDMAPGTVENALRDLKGRDGADRRRFMAARSGDVGLAILPTWAVDAIRSSNDADRPHDNPEIAVDMGIPDELRWVDRALAQMSRRFLLRSIIIRIEFTASVGRGVKARMACEEFEKEVAKRLGVAAPQPQEGGKPALTARQFRYELERGLDWMRGVQDIAA